MRWRVWCGVAVYRVATLGGGCRLGATGDHGSHLFGGVADAESLEAGGEGLTPGVIGQQSVDQSAERFRSGVVLREVDGGFLPGED